MFMLGPDQGILDAKEAGVEPVAFSLAHTSRVPLLPPAQWTQWLLMADVQSVHTGGQGANNTNPGDTEGIPALQEPFRCTVQGTSPQ